MEVFSQIVGTSFRGHDAKVAINELNAEFAQHGKAERTFVLEREPDNQYDALAIKVYLDGVFVGYLAKANNAAIANALDDGAEPAVQVVDLDGRKPVVKVSW